MKKLISVLLMLTLMFSLTACGAKEVKETVDKEMEMDKEVETEKDMEKDMEMDKEADMDKETDMDMEKTKITLGFQADSVGGIQEVIKQFQIDHPEYEVEFANMTNDSAQMHDQLLTSLSSGSDEYDVIAMDVVWAGEFAAAGYLEPTDKLMMEEGWKVADFNAGSMASGKYEGKNYVLPYFPDLGFLYYRKDLVSEEDAMKLESGDYTFDELLAMAEKYKEEAGTKYGYIYQSKQYEGLVCNLNEFSDNWKDVKGGLERMKTFTESMATPDDILVYTEGETHAAFANGDSVFARNWPYMYGIVKSDDTPITPEQVGFAQLPYGGTVGGWLIGINKKTDNMDGAKAFAKYLAGEKGQKTMDLINGYLPGLNRLENDIDILKSNELISNEGFKKALMTTIPRPVVANYSEVSDTIQIAAHSYLSGSKSLEDATKEIEDALK